LRSPRAYRVFREALILISSSSLFYDFFTPLAIISQTEAKINAMMKIEAVIHPYKLDDVKKAINGLGCGQITVSGVLLNQSRGVVTTRYRGSEYRIDSPKVKLELLVAREGVDRVVALLSQAADDVTGGDDGTIVVYELSDAIRIHGGSRLETSNSR
jgi:nitrogen regulatory protein P-II 1